MPWLRKIQIPAAVTMVVAGAALYLLFRSRHLLGFHLLEGLGLGRVVDILRSSVHDVHPPEFVMFCLPDGLWTLGYILIIDRILLADPLRRRLLMASVIPLLGTLSEMLQYVGLMPGTFDEFDLFCYVMPYLSYFVWQLTGGNSQLTVDN